MNKEAPSSEQCPLSSSVNSPSYTLAQTPLATQPEYWTTEDTEFHPLLSLPLQSGLVIRSLPDRHNCQWQRLRVARPSR